MIIKTAAQLYKDELFIIQDGGLIIDCDWHRHLSDLDGDELRKEMIRLHEDADNVFYYQDSSFNILKYINSQGKACVGAFFKIKDKFVDSEFINKSDRDYISNLVGRKDSNGQDILLGDQVRIGDSNKAYRVIWVNSGFWLYDDYYSNIHDELGTDCKITKL